MDVVETLEGLLEEAKRGEIKWIGVAFVDVRNTANSVYAPTLEEGDVGALVTSGLGAISYLDKRFSQNMLTGAVVRLPEGED